MELLILSAAKLHFKSINNQELEIHPPAPFIRWLVLDRIGD